MYLYALAGLTSMFLQALGLDRSPPGVNSCDACDAMYYESGAITYEIYQAFLPSVSCRLH